MRKTVLKTLALVACLLCSLNILAVEAYTCYTSYNKTLTFYYDNYRSSRTGETNVFSSDWRVEGNEIYETERVVFDPSFSNVRPTSTSDWFADMQHLRSITGLNYLNTSQVTDMSFMFGLCHNLYSLDLSSFNTAKVTNMCGMFFECTGLDYLNLSSFNTSQVTNMGGMFDECESLESLDLSSFNTANVTNMGGMFERCGVRNLDLSNFNTAKVTDMSCMFADTNTGSLDLSSFNTARVTDMSYMFYEANLSTIYVGSGWSTASATSSRSMFAECFYLVGGKGTVYDENHTDKAYARIDGGTSNPGYLTEKLEPYACYTSSNTTLTFYYDSQRITRSGTTYVLNTDDSDPGWLYDGTSYDVTKVVFNSSFANARPVSTCEWFYSMENLRSITGLGYLNTENVIYMSGMFGCYSGSLTSLDLSHFNTANVIDMGSMFSGCSGLRSLDLSSFNTSKVKYMSYMFEGCSGLTSLNLSSFNTSNVTNMGYMFVDCKVIKTLDLTAFNTSKVTRMNNMFNSCDNLTTIYVGNGWSTSTVTNSANMFFGCTKIKGGKGTTYDANHVDKLYARIDGGTSSPGYLTDGNAVEAYAVYTPSNTTLTFYYDNQRRSRTGTTYDLNTGYDYPNWNSVNTSITRVVFNSSFANARPTTTYHWFYRMKNITSITGLNYLNTSQVTNMRYMFQECDNLNSLNLSSFNTSNVTDMYGMFENCTNLNSINMSSFNTAKVTNMSYMFCGCANLKSLDVSGFNTAKVEKMVSMFLGCVALESLDLSGFNTEMVDDMEIMFYGCSGLKSLNLSGFNTGRVKDMYYMFRDCSELTSLDLSSFNTSSVTNMYQMFHGCSNLTTIFVGSGWTTAAVTSSSGMFYGCTKIKGGMGTTYDANHVDAAYAHIDGGTSNPGYLTDPNAIQAYAVYSPSTSSLSFYYDKYRASREGTTYDLNVAGTYPDWYTDGTYTSIIRVYFNASFANARPETTYGWFYMMANLKSISGMKNNLNTSEVTNMAYMFEQCTSLTSIDVSGFNTAKVTNMRNMFSKCSGLTALDVTNFNTSNVTNMQRMFSNCSGLTTLDLSGFNTAKVKYMSYMFYGCGNLTTIYAGTSWSTSAVTTSGSMFLMCPSLRGSKGTAYDANHVDVTYAHIDGGPSNPGYLSDVLMGDANGDNAVNIADVTAVIDYILSGNASEINLSVSDVNFDGAVNIADVTAIIDYILNGSW